MDGINSVDKKTTNYLNTTNSYFTFIPLRIFCIAFGFMFLYFLHYLFAVIYVRRKKKKKYLIYHRQVPKRLYKSNPGIVAVILEI